MANNGTQRLGKGLEALLGDNSSAPTEEALNHARVMEIEINRIDPNPNQPRQEFNEMALQELADSISIHGVIQPLLITRGDSGRYTIIAGERRWRAARIAALDKVPAILKEYDAQELMEVSLIENLQREDLNPVEEAEAIRILMDAHGLTQEQVAERVGKSRSAVANALRLLSLQPEILKMLKEGAISPGHARALLSLDDEEARLSLAKDIRDKGLSVRQVEALVSKKASDKNGESVSSLRPRDMHLTAAEDDLRKSLGTKVSIVGSAKRGRISIEYYSQEDLDRLFAIMTGE